MAHDTKRRRLEGGVKQGLVDDGGGEPHLTLPVRAAASLCVRASRDRDGKNVFAMAGRGKATRLVVNTDSGLLGDSDISQDDAAAHVCPVGAIMPKRGAYTTPIGQRYFDDHAIDEVDNASGKL